MNAREKAYNFYRFAVWQIEIFLQYVIENIQNNPEATDVLKAIFSLNQALTNTNNITWTSFEELRQQLAKITNLLQTTTFADKAKDLEYFLDLLYPLAKESGFTPLHFAAGLGIQPSVQTLIDEFNYPADCQDDDGFSPLYVAASRGRLKTVALLAEKYHAPLDEKTKSGDTPLQIADTHQHVSVKLYIQKKMGLPPASKNADSEAKITAGRRLYQAFGGKKISQLTAQEDSNLFNEVLDNHREGVSILIYFLKQFLKRSVMEKAKPHFNQIIDWLENARETTPNIIQMREWKSELDYIHQHRTQEEKAKAELIQDFQNMEPGQLKILLTGCVAHAIGCYIEKIDSDKFMLHIADRGYFATHFSRYHDKSASLKSLVFDREQLEAILLLLQKANEQDVKDAAKTLFTDIPKLAGSVYTENPHIVQSKLKEGLCVFGNAKTVLFSLLIKKFGPEVGRLFYKDFTFFMRETALNEYKKLAGKTNPYVKAGLTIFTKKKENFLKNQYAFPDIAIQLEEKKRKRSR